MNIKMFLQRVLFSPRLTEFVNKNRKYLIINSVVIIATLFISLVFIISPLRKKINMLKNTNQINQITLSNQQILISKKENLKMKIERSNIAIPEDAQILKLGSSLQTMAVKNSMLLRSINFKEMSKEAISKDRTTDNIMVSEKTKNDFLQTEQVSGSVEDIGGEAQSSTVPKNLNSFTFTITLVGSEENFKRFLQTIETNLRLIDVVNMTLPENGSSLASEYTLDLEAYYLAGILGRK